MNLSSSKWFRAFLWFRSRMLLSLIATYPMNPSCVDEPLGQASKLVILYEQDNQISDAQESPQRIFQWL